MLPPSELKNKNFTHVIRGYSSVEVDEHIAFIIEKYTELYRENDALERKIVSMQAEIDKYRNDEESIRSALINAQRASSQILEDANERSEIILRSAKINCDKILSEFKGAVKEERDELLLIRGMVRKFKDDLFLSYQDHIEQIERIAPELDSLDESEFADEAIVRLAVESIKRDIISGTVESDTAAEDAADIVSDIVELTDETAAAADAEEDDLPDTSVATDDDLIAADELFSGSGADDDLDNTAIDINDYLAAEASKSADDGDKYEQLTYDVLMAEARADELTEDGAGEKDGVDDLMTEASEELADGSVQLGMAFDEDDISDGYDEDELDAEVDFETSEDDLEDAATDDEDELSAEEIGRRIASIVGETLPQDDENADGEQNGEKKTPLASDFSIYNAAESDLSADQLLWQEETEDGFLEKETESDDFLYDDGNETEISAMSVSALSEEEVGTIELERQRIGDGGWEKSDQGVVGSILEINDILAQQLDGAKPNNDSRKSESRRGDQDEAEYIDFINGITDSENSGQYDE